MAPCALHTHQEGPEALPVLVKPFEDDDGSGVLRCDELRVREHKACDEKAVYAYIHEHSEIHLLGVQDHQLTCVRLQRSQTLAYWYLTDRLTQCCGCCVYRPVST